MAARIKMIVVPARSFACPYCGSSNTKVTSTVVPRRYHRCQDCKKRFGSMERGWTAPKDGPRDESV